MPGDVFSWKVHFCGVKAVVALKENDFTLKGIVPGKWKSYDFNSLKSFLISVPF